MLSVYTGVGAEVVADTVCVDTVWVMLAVWLAIAVLFMPAVWVALAEIGPEPEAVADAVVEAVFVDETALPSRLYMAILQPLPQF